MQKETDWLILPDSTRIRPSRIASCHWDTENVHLGTGVFQDIDVFVVHIDSSLRFRFKGLMAGDTARVLGDWMIGDYPADEIDSRKWPCMVEVRRAREVQRISQLKEREEKRQQAWWMKLWRIITASDPPGTHAGG